jgi:hypothetical protein
MKRLRFRRSLLEMGKSLDSRLDAKDLECDARHYRQRRRNHMEDYQ